MNQSQFNSSSPITSEDIVFATLYSFIVFFGVLGNGIVITIVRKTPSMHTTTNYLLMNLAVADLLTLLFCPGFYDFALNSFPLSTTLGDVICKIFVGNAIVCIAFDASVLTLCVIAIERFIGIVKPFNSDWNLTRKKACLAIAVVWIMAVSFSFPDILWTKYNTEQTVSSLRYPCTRPWAVYYQSSNVKSYIVSHSLIVIVIPAIVISFCYISVFLSLKHSPGKPVSDETSRKNTRRLLKLLVSLAAAFCALCLPFAGFFFYAASRNQNQLYQSHVSLFLAHRIVRLLIFSNSFVNPLLYAAQSTNYRDALQEEFCCRIKANITRREASSVAKKRRKHTRGEGKNEQQV